MKRYYTTTKTGESVEVPQDLAKQLVKMGKKKPEDFEIEDVPDAPAEPAAPAAPVAPTQAVQAPQEQKVPTLLEAIFPRSTSPEARADGGWMEPPRAMLRFGSDLASGPGRFLRATVGPQSEDEKQTAGAGNLFLKSLAQTELPEGTNIGNRLTYGMLMSPAAVATMPLKGGALPVAATMAAGNQAMNWAEGKPLSGTQFVTETALGTGIGKALQGVGSLAASAPGALKSGGVKLISMLANKNLREDFEKALPKLIDEGAIKATTGATAKAWELLKKAKDDAIEEASRKYKDVGLVNPDELMTSIVAKMEAMKSAGKKFVAEDVAKAKSFLGKLRNGPDESIPVDPSANPGQVWDVPRTYEISKTAIDKVNPYKNPDVTDAEKFAARELRDQVQGSASTPGLFPKVAPDLRNAIAESAPYYASEPAMADITGKGMFQNVSDAGRLGRAAKSPATMAHRLVELAFDRPAIGLGMYRAGEIASLAPADVLQGMAGKTSGAVSKRLATLAQVVRDLNPVGAAPVAATAGAGFQSLAKFAPRAIPAAIDQTSSRRKAP